MERVQRPAGGWHWYGSVHGLVGLSMLSASVVASRGKRTAGAPRDSHPVRRRVGEGLKGARAALPRRQQHPALVRVLAPVPGAVRAPEAALTQSLLTMHVQSPMAATLHTAWQGLRAACCEACMQSRALHSAKVCMPCSKLQTPMTDFMLPQPACRRSRSARSAGLQAATSPRWRHSGSWRRQGSPSRCRRCCSARSAVPGRAAHQTAHPPGTRAGGPGSRLPRWRTSTARSPSPRRPAAPCLRRMRGTMLTGSQGLGPASRMHLGWHAHLGPRR